MSKNRNVLTLKCPGRPERWPYLIKRAPLGWEIIGTVDRRGASGALVRNQHTGIFCMYNCAGKLSSLPQREVIAALDTNNVKPIAEG